MTEFLSLILADAPTSGPDGWASLIIQSGAFGLLAWIVIVAFPKYTAEARTERESAAIRFEATIHLLQDKFEVRNRDVVQAISSQTDSWVQEIRRHTEALRETTKAICRYPDKGHAHS